MLPEISRRCLSCGAAVRAQARFCAQCGQVVGEGEAATAQPQGAGTEERVSAPPVVEKTGADEEIRLEESWRRWEESLGGHAETKVEEGNADGERPAEAGTQLSAPSPELSAPTLPPPDVSSGSEDPHTVRADSAAAATAGAAAPLTRPLTETGRQRAAVAKDTLRPRVERVRERSLVVLEEAAENSGVRFVVIALALFLIFLFFLYLNDKIK